VNGFFRQQHQAVRPIGKFLKLIGRKGQGPGEFNMPIDIVFAKDRLVVWDMGNDRICTLTLIGGFIKGQKFVRIFRQAL